MKREPIAILFTEKTPCFEAVQTMAMFLENAGGLCAAADEVMDSQATALAFSDRGHRETLTEGVEEIARQMWDLSEGAALVAGVPHQVAFMVMLALLVSTSASTFVDSATEHLESLPGVVVVKGDAARQLMESRATGVEERSVYGPN